MSIRTAARRRWAKIVVAIAAAYAVLLSFLTLTELSLLAVISIGGTALAFLLAAPFMGAMPTPEEEGRSR